VTNAGVQQRIFFVFESECRLSPLASAKKNWPEPLNLESQSTWWCQWSTLNVQWLCMIIWTWVLSSWRFSAVNEIWTRDRSSKRNVWIIIGRSVPRAYLSYFFLASIMICLIPFLRAKVLNHNPRVKSLQFKNRSGRIQWLPNGRGLSARKFRICSPPCVDEAINLSLLFNELFCISPFFNGSKISQLWSFCSTNGGVRAKQRNVASTEKVMIFLGSKPGPSLFNFLNCFVTLNLF